jgi:hypothetical protein
MNQNLTFQPKNILPFIRDRVPKSQAATNVTVTGWARKRDGTGWQLVLSFTDRDGRRHEVPIKRSAIIQGDLLFELLDDHGYVIPADRHSRAALRWSILAADPESRFWIESKGRLVSEAGSKEGIETAVGRILARLPKLAKLAIDISKRKHRVDWKAAASASVLRIVHTNGARLLAVRPAALKKIIGGMVPEKAVAAELEKQGVLIPRGNGRRTRELRFPAGNVRRSYYCLRLSAEPRRRSSNRTVATEQIR